MMLPGFSAFPEGLRTAAALKQRREQTLCQIFRALCSSVLILGRKNKNMYMKVYKKDTIREMKSIIMHQILEFKK